MIHGGDIYRNKVAIDFSVSINPLGIPKKVQRAIQEAAVYCMAYPDINNELLLEAIEEMTGIDKNYLICGNGASELLSAIVHTVKPKKTLIPIPSFAGYEYAVNSSDGEIIYYYMKEEEEFSLNKDFLEVLNCDIDLVFLANPNNPTGSMIEQDLLKNIIKLCKEKEILIVVDESFIEFTGIESKYSLKNSIRKYKNVIIVRSFTKIFAIPGIRLGYLFCGDMELIRKIKKHIPEWNLSVFAQYAGVTACKEMEYIDKTVEFVNEERKYLKSLLEKENIKVFNSMTNYLLFYSEIPFYEKLLEKQILIRDCSNFVGMKKGYYRVAVGNRKNNNMLIDAIKKN